ncbi:MAG: hypothetical protein E6G44_04420 [Actinobacteria bacterium]|nr:MAG: hypothetical protein E6G44_04420 [Actinomycetota bacterium]
MTPLGLGWPNIVSVARVFLAPFLVVLIAAQDRNASYLAAAIFIAGAATDGLDTQAGGRLWFRRHRARPGLRVRESGVIEGAGFRVRSLAIWESPSPATPATPPM